LTALAIKSTFPNMTEQAIIFGTWFCALVTGAVGSLGVFQALTGHRTLLFTPRGIDWSVGELRLFGLAGAIYALSLAVYVLLGSLAVTANQFSWDLPVSIAVVPLVAIWWAFVGLMRQRHNRRWPFNGQLNPS
jgi:hypothetical protein